ncbi:hypothetical protein HK101_005934 [Irineochytrium annulatum]|nr:hypothetical protein HK101_005934 [Irineochytrium annulatum]
MGLETHVADDGLDALDLLSASSFCDRIDLIFMDVTMPRLDGIECTREIRRLEHEEGSSLYRRRVQRGGRKALIVAISGNATRESVDVGIGAGMDHYLLKPWTRAEIARVCRAEA